MPCGGIYPIANTWIESFPKDETKPEHCCWMCGKGGCEHFCDEWDTFIHARCALAFLATEEGQIIIKHEHQVLLDFSKETHATTP